MKKHRNGTKVQKSPKQTDTETEGEIQTRTTYNTERKTIQEVEDIIKSKNYFFQLVSCHQNKKFTKETLELVEEVFGGFNAYLQMMVGMAMSNVICIQLLQKNGSSFKKRDFFMIVIY